MPFGRQIYASLAQALAALSSDAAQALCYKHLGETPDEFSMMGFIHLVSTSPDEAIEPLLVEVVAERAHLRHAAPTRHVFDARVQDLGRWLFHDGWNLEDNRLVRVAPAVEEATGVRDELLSLLGTSSLDADGCVRRAIEEAAVSFRSAQPDFNDSTVKVRLAFEAIGRRAALALANRRTLQYPEDSWGRALSLLRQAAVIDQSEEDLLARVYTFISPGAHVAGISDEEWARLARTLGISGTYFLLKRYLAAP